MEWTVLQTELSIIEKNIGWSCFRIFDKLSYLYGKSFEAENYTKYFPTGIKNNIKIVSVVENLI